MLNALRNILRTMRVKRVTIHYGLCGVKRITNIMGCAALNALQNILPTMRVKRVTKHYGLCGVKRVTNIMDCAALNALQNIMDCGDIGASRCCVSLQACVFCVCFV